MYIEQIDTQKQKLMLTKFVPFAPQARNILVSQKDGHLRASLHFYNDEADVDRFLDAVAELGGGRG